MKKHYYVCPVVATGDNAHYPITEESEGKQVNFAIVPYNGRCNPENSGKEQARQDAMLIVAALNGNTPVKIEAKLALANWQKYNKDKGDEIVYQAEKMATALAALIGE